MSTIDLRPGCTRSEWLSEDLYTRMNAGWEDSFGSNFP